MQTNASDLTPTKLTSRYLTFSIAAEIFSLVYLLLIPSDPHAQSLFGLSPSRWILAGGLIACGVVSVMILALSNRQERLEKLIHAALFSVSVEHFSFLAVVISSFGLIVSFFDIFPNRYVIERLRPLIVLILLLSGGLAYAHATAFRRKPWLEERNFVLGVLRQMGRIENGIIHGIQQFSTYPVLIAAIQAVTFPLLFQIALTHTYPAGFAGLYALMAETIAKNGFALPASVAFYGPGGMPFAYPPFGLYVMAFVTQVFHVEPLAYLRFFPPLFMWLSLIPVAMITLDLSRSKPAAFTAAIIVGGSQRIFMIQGTSGGIVRALAFLAAMWGIYLFLRAYRQPGWRLSILSGIFIGLSSLTHLGYAEFAAIFIAGFVLTHLFSKKAWLCAIIAGTTALLLALPWAAAMVQRYGWNVFLGALQSHGNDYFLLLLTGSKPILPWFENTLRPIFNTPMLWGIIALGLLYSLAAQQWLIPVVFVLLLFFTSESDRYLITVGGICAGLVVGKLVGTLCHHHPGVEPGNAITRPAIILCLLVFGVFYWSGWTDIGKHNEPVIGKDALLLANYVQKNSSENLQYLITAQLDEAEWFPYLIRRTPVAASWGGEWLGSYSEQFGYLLEIINCTDQQSSTCLENLIERLPTKPDLLITHTDTSTLNQELSESKRWKMDYQNSTYVMWKQAN